MNALLPGTILFDMDDTILADDAVSERCWELVCRDFSSRIEGLGAGNLLGVIREARRWYWSDFDRSRRGGRQLTTARREILDLSFDRLGFADNALRDEMVDSFNGRKPTMVEAVPGAMETLHTLRRQGTKLGLVTNGNGAAQRAKIDRFGLEHLFDSILVEGEFGVGKPDRRVFLQVLKELHAPPEDAWMVGDNLLGDVGGAQGAGIYGVWVDWREQGLPESSPVRPDRIIRAVSELIE